MPRHSPCALYSLTFRRCGLHILRSAACSRTHPFRHISSSRHKRLRWFVPRGDGGTLFRPSRLRLRDLVLLNYAGNQQVTSQNCNCYPHLFRCSTIKNSQLFFQVSLKDLSVALLFHHMLHCSVFKVQLPASFEARSQNPIPWVLRSNAKLDSWWARVGSNHRPYDYQSYALAS